MQIEIPKDIEGLLTERAHRAGFDNVSEYVVKLVLGDDLHQAQSATVRALRKKTVAGPGGEHNGGVNWNEELNERRCGLIDKDIQVTLSDDERRELEALTEQFREYRRHVAPLPIEGARRLHAELVDKKRRNEEHRSE